MIVFELRCGAGHGFEAWFRSGEAFEAQRQDGEVACPHCGDTGVSKAPMAPRIGKGQEAEAEAAKARAEVMGKLAELRQQVEQNCDYVGERFAEEARRIHYGESEARGIYGETTSEQAAALADEGVPFSRIPWLPRTNS